MDRLERRDFLKEFRNKIDNIGKEDNVADVKKALEPEAKESPKAKADDDEGPLFNIHRRSLPVGSDIPLFFGITKEDSETLLKLFLHTTEGVVNGQYYVTYYDLVPVEADDLRLSVYWNPKEFVRESI